MSSYRINFTKAAHKQFTKLPQLVQNRIASQLKVLSVNPLGSGSKQLVDFDMNDTMYEKYYRIRVGDYRVVYAIENDELIITLVRVEHRSKVYRK